MPNSETGLNLESVANGPLASEERIKILPCSSSLSEARDSLVGESWRQGKRNWEMVQASACLSQRRAKSASKSYCFGS